MEKTLKNKNNLCVLKAVVDLSVHRLGTRSRTSLSQIPFQKSETRIVFTKSCFHPTPDNTVVNVIKLQISLLTKILPLLQTAHAVAMMRAAVMAHLGYYNNSSTLDTPRHPLSGSRLQTQAGKMCISLLKCNPINPTL